MVRGLLFILYLLTNLHFEETCDHSQQLLWIQGCKNHHHNHSNLLESLEVEYDL